ncbi:MAG: restriction endonuclease subunit S [Holdemanella sp.]|nr:restriction endonuclease subunit S [Holdemanella sp.]
MNQMVNYVFLSVYFYSVPNLRFREFSLPWHQTPIKDLLSFQNGINGAPEQYGKGIKYISVGDILNNDYITYDKIVGSIDISQETLKNYSVTYGDILFQRSSEIKDDIGRTNVYLDKDNTATFGGFVIRGKKIGDYNPSFFSFLLKSPSSRKSIVRLGAGAQHYNIGQENIKTLSFYFPNEIEQVKIANLLSKIDKRIQTQIKIIDRLYSQIKYIKGQILNMTTITETKPLGQLCNISTGKRDANEMKSNGSYKFFTCSKDDYCIDTYSFDGEALIISGNGELGLIKYYNGKFDAYQRTYVLQNFKCHPKYLMYVLQNKLPKKIEKEKNVGAMPYIVLKTLTSINIDILNMHDQIKIVNILNKFEEKLENDRILLELFEKEKSFLLKNLFV